MTMKYMLMIYTDENCWSEGERERCMETSKAICHELQTKGQFVSAAPLHPVSLATSVRVRNDRRVITDGPFAETVEQLGGYFVIDVANLDEALAIAAACPGQKRGPSKCARFSNSTACRN
ncbi:MAG: YciI family protein [Pirellulales bacterium]